MVSTFKGAAQLGATAVALGLSLTLPCGVASAEDSQPDSPTSSVAATSDSGVRKSATARRPARETRTADEAAAPRSAPSAASKSAPSAASKSAASRANRARLESPAAVARTALPGGAVADRKSAALNTPAGPDQPDSAPMAAPARDAPAATPPTLRRAPRAAAVAGTASAPLTAGALAAATDPFSALLSPIQGLLEGVGLLIRRTLFNQAPSVNPVQITGQSTGPITGTIGASDPEGDPIVYSVTRNAQYGRVMVGADGSYTYTPGQEFTGTDTFTVAATDTGFHINLLDLFRAASTPANAVVTQGTPAANVLQFQFIYGTGAHLWTPAARSSLESAATVLSTYIVVSTPVTVTFDVTGEYSPLSTTLATAGSDFISADPGFLPTVVQHKILTGVDSNGSTADGEITWNFARSWSTGDTADYTQFDLEAVATHELLHTLGFLSYVDGPGANTGQSWTVYDSFLVNSDGTKVIGSDFTWNTAYDANLAGGNGGIFFGGPDAVAAYGALVPLYTPSPWESGSSISHLDDDTFVGVNRRMMNAKVRVSRGIRDLSALELAILADLGYTVAPQSSAAMSAFV